jgi:hypothetical protein
MFVLGKHFQPALPANIRIGRKGLPRTNTLTYYGNLQITAVKGFIVQACTIKLFMAVIVGAS